MAEITVTAHITAKAGAETQVEEAFRALLEPTHAENGCLLYALHRIADRPGQLLFVERWASREHLDAHLASPHLRRLGEITEGLLAEPVQITYLEPLPGGDPELGRL